MADFGYSFLPNEGDEDVVFQPALSWPWNAPEYHHRGFSIEQAQKQDIYSFGMLCFWVLFQAEISAKLPESARGIPGPDLANQQNVYSYRLLGQWKHEKRLQHVALEMVTDNFRDRERDILTQIFNCTLAQETNEREQDFRKLENLLNQLFLDKYVAMTYPLLSLI